MFERIYGFSTYNEVHILADEIERDREKRLF